VLKALFRIPYENQALLFEQRLSLQYFSFASIFVELHAVLLQICNRNFVVNPLIMATLKARIFKHHKKADGTYNVKICVYHNSKRVYIDTDHYLTDKKLGKNLEIKDAFINSQLFKTLEDYRLIISGLGKQLPLIDADQLKSMLLKKDQPIDFIQFCQLHIDLLKENNQTKSAANLNTVKNAIADFTNHMGLPIENISLNFIGKFERYLRNPRIMTRIDQFKREYKIEGKPLPNSSIHVYLRDFRGLFSAAMRFYNQPSIGLIPIPYNPFLEYKIVDAPETEKRSIGAPLFLKFKECEVEAGGRAELARNLGMLSFYLCGMNAIDLFKQQYIIKNGRIEYNRSKTQGKRKDNAFISIKVPKEAELLLAYASGLNQRYSSIGNLNKALSKGMAQLSLATDIPHLTFYAMRHTFATIARQRCHLQTDFVSEALNHVEFGKGSTKIYIARDWNIVDKVQLAVLNYVVRMDNKSNNEMVVSTRMILNQIQLPALYREGLAKNS
jgi:hypothetical protein